MSAQVEYLIPSLYSCRSAWSATSSSHWKLFATGQASSLYWNPHDHYIETLVIILRISYFFSMKKIPGYCESRLSLSSSFGRCRCTRLCLNLTYLQLRKQLSVISHDLMMDLTGREHGLKERFWQFWYGSAPFGEQFWEQVQLFYFPRYLVRRFSSLFKELFAKIEWIKQISKDCFIHAIQKR